MEFNFEEYKTQGIKVNYYYICKRKLWLYSKGITMEQKSDRVLQGKNLHEAAYPRKKSREVLIDDILKLDILEDDKVGEIKISSKMEEADVMQLSYYLYYLKQLGIYKTGTINYVKEKTIKEVSLTRDLEEKVVQTLINIKVIENQEYPPKVKKLKYCKKCAYYEFCYAMEVD